MSAQQPTSARRSATSHHAVQGRELAVQGRELIVRQRLQAHRQRTAVGPLARVGTAANVGEPPATGATFSPSHGKGNSSGPASSVRASSVRASSDQRTLVAQLAREIDHLEGVDCAEASLPVVSTGCSALDACLPKQGYTPGSVIEYLRTAPACGASYLAFAAASSAMQANGGYLVIVDTQDNFYPPSLVAHGINLDRLVWVRPESHADAVWAVDQALRTPAVSAVVADLEKVDDRAARRFQLSAESGAGFAFLLRSAVARRRPSWATVQWLVRSPGIASGSLPATDQLPSRPDASLQDSGWKAAMGKGAYGAGLFSNEGRASRYLQVKLIRNRGGRPGAIVHLEIDGVTGALKSTARERNRHEQQGGMRLAAELAHPKSSSRRAAAG